MVGKEFLYQSVTLVSVVLFFDFLERSRPGHAVDRRRDLSLNVLALLVTAAGGETWKASLMSGFNMLDLGGILSPAGLHALPGAIKVLIGLVLADFSLYWVHRAMHRRTLWPTHIFHHSIEQLWWLAGSRTSLTHLFLFAVPQTLLAYYVLALTPGEAAIAFSLGVIVNVWIHTNIWVNLGPLEWILITPNYHRIHHGARGLSNKNLGFILTIWDRMFGTYVNPQSTGKDFPLGFASTENRLLRMIVGF